MAILQDPVALLECAKFFGIGLMVITLFAIAISLSTTKGE